MKHMMILILSSVLAMFSSCGKSSTSSTDQAAPTNLNVSAVVQTDNSGNVAFTATATNANSYDYDFGNGVYRTVPSGVYTYQYPSSGTYTVNVTAKNNSGKTISKSVSVTVTVTQTLVWGDEFNGNGAPDPAKWGYDLGNNGGWGNSELEYYTSRPENVVQQGGVLKINMIKESYMGFNYTSARILSKNKFDFKYGKVEISAKLPSGVGTWPALWMLGSDIATSPWPACGEIDIMEHLGRDLNNIYGTFHYPGHSGGSADGATKMITGATTAFHKYGLEWNANTIKISVDDVVYKTLVNSPSVPFNHNFFFIMNLAMGGNFAGPPDPAVLGGTMEVDYIRVYN
jgi:beta-glucanase (GH16 family)